MMPQEKLSVVQIIDMLNTGGAERVLVTLSNILQEHGHEVAVITTVRPGVLSKELNAGIKQISLKRKWKWNPAKMYRLVQLVKKYDIIHVHSSYNLSYLYLSARLFNLKKDIFFQEHYGNVVNEKIPRHKKFIYPETNFIAVSKQQQRWALEKLHIPVQKIFLLRNTVLKINSGSSYEKNKNIKKILLISNFLHEKNIEFAIELVSELQRQSTEKIYLTIIGQLYDKNYFVFIQQLIKEKNLKNNIRIITDCTNVQPLLEEYDLALHTSKSESGPLVLIEYLAQRLPFISYNTGEVAEIVKKELPELIIDSFDKNEWIDRIKKLPATPQSELSSALSNIYEKYFSAEIYYQKCISIYKTGLNEKAY